MSRNQSIPSPDARFPTTLLDLSLMDLLLGNIVFFSKRMGKDKSEGQDAYCDSYPVADALEL